MALVMKSAKGCVYTVRRGSSRGFYALRPGLSGASSAPILMDGVDGGEQDAIFRVKTLDRSKFIYVFGDDFGDLTIRGIALLGRSSEGGRTFSRVYNYFQANRISAKRTPITVSMPGSASMKCYLTQLLIGSPDASFHVQPFAFRGTSVSPKSR